MKMYTHRDACMHADAVTYIQSFDFIQLNDFLDVCQILHKAAGQRVGNVLLLELENT